MLPAMNSDMDLKSHHLSGLQKMRMPPKSKKPDFGHNQEARDIQSEEGNAGDDSGD